MLAAPPEYAGVPRRLAAFALDCLVIAGYLIALTLIFAGWAFSSRWPSPTLAALTNPVLADWLTFLTVVLPIGLYFAWLESSAAQATWGKRKLGLRVVTRSGGRLSRGRAFIRALVKLLPWQLAHTSIYHIPGWPLAPADLAPFSIVGLTLVWVLVVAYVSVTWLSPTHRAPYDWLSGAYVVVVPSATQAVAQHGSQSA